MQWHARKGIGRLRSASVIEIVLVVVGTFEQMEVEMFSKGVESE
jgi:hypothetical protein